MIGHHLIHIHDELRSLEQALDELTQALLAAEGPIWLPDGGDPVDDRRRACQALAQLYHNDTLAPPASGLLYCPPRARALVDAVNARKDRFKAAVQTLRAEAGVHKNGVMRVFNQARSYVRDPAVAEALQALQAQRINLLWCYRHVTVLPEQLESISWTWAHQRSIRRVDREQAIILADELEDPARSEARKRLLALAPATPLAQVKPVASHLRANLVYTEGQGEQARVRRRMVTTPTVLLLPQEQWPRIRWPGEDSATGARLQRRDQKIETEPYVYALRLHRYQATADA